MNRVRTRGLLALMALILLVGGVVADGDMTDPFARENEIAAPAVNKKENTPETDPFHRSNALVVSDDPFAKENEIPVPGNDKRETPNSTPEPGARNSPPPARNPKYRAAVPFAQATVTPASARPGETVTWKL